jgi:Cu(I)/Ag(I) efflux system membrane fusion protein
MKRMSLGAILVVGLAVGIGSFYLGRVTQPASTASGPSSAASQPGRTILYWHDPMVPGQRFDKPGKSPFMDMQLVPVYADSAASSGVQVSAAVQQNLGIRYATVRRATTSSSFDAVGAVQFDERRNVAVQTRVAGYVERLAVRAPMERVRKGQPLATVFAPDWIGPQNELIALKRAGVPDDLVAAARARLRALSVPDELVRRSEEAGTAQARFTLVSPEDGVVAELAVREGVAVTPGMTLFRIAGLATVWAVAEVPEAQAARLVRGQKVKATLQADASQTFEGELKEILPEVSTATRTLKARFEVDNRAGRLTPGMLLRLAVAGPQSERLVVSSEAVIRTGKRAVVIVRNAQGGFEPRDVSLGLDFGDDVEVVAGLNAGDQVVASGQFLIDSEARLRSVLGNMSAPASAVGASVPAILAPMVHSAEGKVEGATADALTISHGPVATMNWPAMTMGFAKPDPKAFADVRPGDTVHFRFKEGGPSGYELVEVHKLATGASK